MWDGKSGLPGVAFTDESWFGFEAEALLLRRWLCVALADDVAACGDLYPVTVVGLPLLVVRGSDQEVRVFHNVCSHRGAQLVEVAECSAPRITCP